MSRLTTKQRRSRRRTREVPEREPVDSWARGHAPSVDDMRAMLAANPGYGRMLLRDLAEQMDAAQALARFAVRRAGLL